VIPIDLRAALEIPLRLSLLKEKTFVGMESAFIKERERKNWAELRLLPYFNHHRFVRFSSRSMIRWIDRWMEGWVILNFYI
jgi:hypothetical protein